MTTNNDNSPTLTPAGVSAPRKLAVAAAISAVLLGTAWVLAPASGAFAATDVTQASTRQALPIQGLNGVADLVELVQPAVVNVSVKGSRVSKAGLPGPNVQVPPGMEEFFKQFRMPEQGQRGHEQPYQGVGSGFIVSADGWVVTNNHVVDGADEIFVTLQDGTRYPAVLHGRDEKTDLALLKVESDESLPHVRFGDSEAARVGEQVVAIGNPFGLGGTVTTGIISARGRKINSGPYDDFLQVDAAINRGNSGGPLFNLAGEVIGINSAIFSPSGGSVGIGFAIPSSLAQVVLDDLRDDGRVERGWLGVQIQGVSEEIAESLGLPTGTEGALVSQVLPKSPALAAGIVVGDVIVGFNGTSIDEVRDLTRAVAAAQVSEDSAVEVWRGGKLTTLQVAIGSMPSQEKVADAGARDADGDADARIGLALAPLDAKTRSRFKVGDDVQGALIVGVADEGPAAKQGLRPGDVIVMVGQTRVEGPADVTTGVKTAAGDSRKSVLLLVDREGSQRFVTVPLDKA